MMIYIGKLIHTGVFYCVFLCLGMVPKIVNAQLPDFEAVVLREINLNNIPSASGMLKFQQSYFVVADNAPFLFELNSNFQLKRKIEIYSTKELYQGSLSSNDKPDFECIAVVPWGKDHDLLVFGSGSDKGRETMVRIDFDDDKVNVIAYSLKKFYNLLEDKTSGDGEINIEGAGYWKGSLILLNRADNSLMMIDLDDFKKYIRDDDKDKPKVKTIPFKLPSIHGVSARFSGMTVLADQNILLFSASVENDPNWMVSENILGSFVGMIDLQQLENTEPVCKMVMKNKKVMPEKLESVEVVEVSGYSMKLVGVTDNDDGTSKLVEIEFKKHMK